MRAIDREYRASGPLADIIGSSAMTRAQMVKALWVKIDAAGIRGTDDSVVEYKGKTYKKGQVLLTGNDPAFRALCKKDKIAFFEVSRCINDNLEDA